MVTVVFGLLLVIGLRSKYTDASKQVKRIHLIEALRTVGFNKVVWLGVLIQILNIIPYWGFASMGPYLFMTYKGFSAAEAGQFFGTIYGIGGLSGVLLGFFADRFGRKPMILFLAALNTLCAILIFHVIPQTSYVLYVVGAMMGIGLHAIYVLGYTIAQDGVSTAQIGLATGIVGASSYFLSFFSGPLMGILTSTLGYAAALDIMVVTFEAVLFGVAIVMKETQPRHAEV
jgi:sugar phosphate permease